MSGTFHLVLALLIALAMEAGAEAFGAGRYLADFVARFVNQAMQ